MSLSVRRQRHRRRLQRNRKYRHGPNAPVTVKPEPYDRPDNRRHDFNPLRANPFDDGMQTRYCQSRFTLQQYSHTERKYWRNSWQSTAEVYWKALLPGQRKNRWATVAGIDAPHDNIRQRNCTASYPIRWRAIATTKRYPGTNPAANRSIPHNIRLIMSISRSTMTSAPTR